ncbi:MAG: VWA-like domain-containing protein, partial [Thermoplasmatales archaeon]
HKESDEEEGQGGVGDEGDVEEFWKRAIAEAVNYAKSIGRIPAGIEIILEILKPKVSWQTLFKQAIVQGPGLQVLTTWRRPHRKLPQNAPGYQRLTVSNIWCCVDVSGSMVGERLNQVMSEVFAIAKSLNAKVHIIAWDVDAYPTTLSEVRQKMSVRGGGGTEIKKALELLEKKFQSNDIVVILTDGQIFDIEDPEIQAKLERLARRSASAVFATTFSTPSLPHGWRTVVIS